MNSKAFPFGVYTFDDTILSCQIVKCVKIVKIVKIVNLFQFLHQVRIGFLDSILTLAQDFSYLFPLQPIYYPVFH